MESSTSNTLVIPLQACHTSFSCPDILLRDVYSWTQVFEAFPDPFHRVWQSCDWQFDCLQSPWCSLRLPLVSRVRLLFFLTQATSSCVSLISSERRAISSAKSWSVQNVAWVLLDRRFCMVRPMLSISFIASSMKMNRSTPECLLEAHQMGCLFSYILRSSLPLFTIDFFSKLWEIRKCRKLYVFLSFFRDGSSQKLSQNHSMLILQRFDLLSVFFIIFLLFFWFWGGCQLFSNSIEDHYIESFLTIELRLLPLQLFVSLKSTDFDTGIMLSTDHSSNIVLFIKTLLQRFKVSSSRLHLFNTFDPMPSSPFAFLLTLIFGLFFYC